MTYFSRDIVTLITALIKKNIISGFTNFVVLTKANLKILGGRENVQQLSIHNTHNLIHAGTTVISTTHVIQELQKYPQLISCRNYKNLHNSCHARITKNIHNSFHARFTNISISTTHVMQELQKYPQLLSCEN